MSRLRKEVGEMNLREAVTALDRIARIGPFEAMCEDERAAGFTLVRPGEVPWLSAADWPQDIVISIKDKEVRIVAIKAKEPGRGAFRRLIEAVEAHGLQPTVVAPLFVMPAILKRWGWKRRIIGTGFNQQEIWRPRKRKTP